MTVRKVVAGSVLAAGLSVAGMLSAGTASALGFAYDNGDGTGGTSVGTDATAFATPGNTAIAISVLRPSQAHVVQDETGSPTGNSAVSIDGFTVIGGSATNNTVVNVGGHTTVGDYADGNTIYNVGSAVQVSGPGDGGVTNVSVCGTTISGQADHITVSSAC